MGNGGLIQIASAIDERFIEIDAIRRGEVVGAIPTGFTDVDKILQGGVRKSDLMMVAGRPSSGKTAFMMAISLNMASKGTSVGWFSLEMSTRGLVSRLMSMKSLVNNEFIRTGEVNTEDMIKLRAAGTFLSSLPFYIDDSGGISVKDMRARLAAQPVDVVFIDYIQLIGCRDSISESERVTKISRELKELCKETKLPFIVAAQLNRQLEARRDKRPMLSDLRSSGQLEQDSDEVIGLYRPEVYDDSPEFANYGEAIILKNRDGSLGCGKLSFAGKYSLFSNYVSPQQIAYTESVSAGINDWSDLGE
jgi:replicative DNA helicase